MQRLVERHSCGAQTPPEEALLRPARLSRIGAEGDNSKVSLHPNAAARQRAERVVVDGAKAELLPPNYSPPCV